MTEKKICIPFTFYRAPSQLLPKHYSHCIAPVQTFKIQYDSVRQKNLRAFSRIKYKFRFLILDTVLPPLSYLVVVSNKQKKKNPIVAQKRNSERTINIIYVQRVNSSVNRVLIYSNYNCNDKTVVCNCSYVIFTDFTIKFELDVKINYNIFITHKTNK